MFAHLLVVARALRGDRALGACGELLGGPGRLPARASHGTVRADFPHTARHVTASLRPQSGRPELAARGSERAEDESVPR